MEGKAAEEGRTWSWAASAAEAEARRREVNELVGQRIRAVRYIALDYGRYDLHPELIDRGPRVIMAESEWDEPTWLFDGFDAMDYGLELTTESGEVFSLTWDPPGHREGIGFQPVPMLGSAVRSDADVAIWEVTDRAANWTPLLGGLVCRPALRPLGHGGRKSVVPTHHLARRGGPRRGHVG